MLIRRPTFRLCRSSSVRYEGPKPVNVSVEFGLVNVLAFFSLNALPAICHYVRR
jgi:hypothetical protein